MRIEKENVSVDSYVEPLKLRAEESRWQNMLQMLRRNPALPFGILIVLTLGAASLLAPLIAPADPLSQDLFHRLDPPFWSTGGSLQHPLGTDQLGRDFLSRLLYGGRLSLSIAVPALLVSAILGTALGLLAGYFGGYYEAIIMRTADIQLALPPILLAIVVVAALGSSFVNLIFVLILSGWVLYARIMYNTVRAIREREFVLAAMCIGCPNGRILWKHIVPNSWTPIIVMGALHTGRIIITEATLSFLGLGVPPPAPSWGSILGEGRDYLWLTPWLTLLPGLVIMIMVGGVNVLGEGLRIALNPRARGR